jgi:hypothetical protein
MSCGATANRCMSSSCFFKEKHIAIADLFKLIGL